MSSLKAFICTLLFAQLCFAVSYGQKTSLSEAQKLDIIAFKKYELGDYAGALSNLDQAVKLPPNTPGFSLLFVHRGEVESALKNDEAAIRDFTTTLEMCSTNSEAYMARGLSRGRSGDARGAVQDFTSFLALIPSNSAAYYYRGNLRNELGDLTNAILDFTSAIECNPSNAWAYNNRALVSSDVAGNPNESVADLSRAIEIDSSNAVFYCNRASVLSSIGKTSDAISDYKKAIQLNPQYFKAYRGLGYVQSDLFQFSEALENFRISLLIYPSQASIEPRVLLLRMRLGELNTVTNELNKVFRNFENTSGPDGKPIPTVSEIAPFLGGFLSQDDLFRDATNSVWPQEIRKGQLCKAYYYAGMKRLVLGDASGAISLLRHCTDNGSPGISQDGFNDYISAKAELNQLNPTRQP